MTRERYAFAGKLMLVAVGVPLMGCDPAHWRNTATLAIPAAVAASPEGSGASGITPSTPYGATLTFADGPY